MKKILTILFLCATPVSAQEVESLPGMQEVMAEMVKGRYRARESSATAWDESDVLVTSAHIDAIIEGEICNNPLRDVKFVGKDEIKPVIWRQPLAMEPAEFRGLLRILDEGRTMEMNIEIKSQGLVLRNTTIKINNESFPYVWLGAGKVIKGMSGGPVVAKNDGAVLGIIMGRPVKGLKKYEDVESKYTDLNLFIPYNVLKEVWKECKR